LSKGDEMYLFTDGLTELYDEKTDKTFGEQYLQEIIERNTEKDIEERINAVIEAINDFGVEHVRDDITFLGIEVK
jgi:serine phosphatase RsbU (regulator of sigma subunit)